MKDMISAMEHCGFGFDMAIVLSENYQEDCSPILWGDKDVEEVEPESVRT